jgi:hypothetical protein
MPFVLDASFSRKLEMTQRRAERSIVIVRICRFLAYNMIPCLQKHIRRHALHCRQVVQHLLQVLQSKRVQTANLLVGKQGAVMRKACTGEYDAGKVTLAQKRLSIS